MELQPEILQHPNIPKPLHGLAPREIKGKSWWDKTRKAVYKKQGDCCIACGVHKSEAKYHNWIEAHEYYNMDYVEGSMKIEKIVGLCHSCHAYIHSGRTLVMYQKGNIGFNKAYDIMTHGFKVLKNNNLEPWYGHVQAFLGILSYRGIDIPENMMVRYEQLKRQQKPEYMQPDWSKWYLELEGEKYYGKFNNQREWKESFR